MTVSASSKIATDSVALNHTPTLCPDSCQIISGRVLPITAAHATIRGHELDDAGAAAFIGLADVAAEVTAGARAPCSIFPAPEFRPPGHVTNRSRRECNP